MSKKHFNVDEHEKEIMDDFEKDKFVSVSDFKEEIQRAKQAASNYTKRENRINIRISGADLNMIRKKAIEEGLPYQTLLASIIHKFAAGRLIEKNRS